MALMFHVGMKGGVPEDPAAMSEEGKEVLRGCLQHDINSRKSAAELLKLPYFADQRRGSGSGAGAAGGGAHTKVP